ncbi:MAG: hemolysin III family protein [Acidobacteriota bacterium]
MSTSSTPARATNEPVRGPVGGTTSDDAPGSSHRARYTLGEEISHAVSHGLGIVLSIAGLTVLVAFAALYGTTRHVVGSAIFGTTLVLLYTASTLYHSIPLPRAKGVLRILDHSAIYLLIAGTYTPFTLIVLADDPRGTLLLGVLWGLAIAGIVVTATALERSRLLSLILYVGMGWSALLVARPLIAGLETGGLVLLVGGGLAYTLGVVFYLLRRMPYHHMVWHLFVLAGSVLHYFAVLLYLIPRR